jgi:hypothetical protein
VSGDRSMSVRALAMKNVEELKLLGYASQNIISCKVTVEVRISSPAV